MQLQCRLRSVVVRLCCCCDGTHSPPWTWAMHTACRFDILGTTKPKEKQVNNQDCSPTGQAALVQGQAWHRTQQLPQLPAGTGSSLCVQVQSSHLPPQVWPLIGRGIPAPTLLARVQAIRPSLGASGAVIALFALVAARQPDRQARNRMHDESWVSSGCPERRTQAVCARCGAAAQPTGGCEHANGRVEFLWLFSASGPTEQSRTVSSQQAIEPLTAFCEKGPQLAPGCKAAAQVRGCRLALSLQPAGPWPLQHCRCQSSTAGGAALCAGLHVLRFAAPLVPLVPYHPYFRP